MTNSLAGGTSFGTRSKTTAVPILAASFWHASSTDLLDGAGGTTISAIAKRWHASEAQPLIADVRSDLLHRGLSLSSKSDPRNGNPRSTFEQGYRSDQGEDAGWDLAVHFRQKVSPREIVWRTGVFGNTVCAWLRQTEPRG
ncbi:hypothetical protein [Burkholderia puraquae]|uniref:hypothetical protein n=1 Tax=Burkholderia puraquae TaxID=1904757 RepID=UPI001054894B|nr:hypothetical protein [Burkholderia puraquae]